LDVLLRGHFARRLDEAGEQNKRVTSLHFARLFYADRHFFFLLRCWEGDRRRLYGDSQAEVARAKAEWKAYLEEAKRRMQAELAG
jgi:hypothetical protein